MGKLEKGKMTPDYRSHPWAQDDEGYGEAPGSSRSYDWRQIEPVVSVPPSDFPPLPSCHAHAPIAAAPTRSPPRRPRRTGGERGEVSVCHFSLPAVVSFESPPAVGPPPLLLEILDVKKKLRARRGSWDECVEAGTSTSRAVLLSSISQRQRHSSGQTDDVHCFATGRSPLLNVHRLLKTS